MFKSILHVNLIVLLVLGAIHASLCVPYRPYRSGAAVVWEWDDQIGSGTGDGDDQLQSTSEQKDPVPTEETESVRDELLPKSERSRYISEAKRRTFNGKPGFQKQKGSPCHTDRECGSDQFCHEHYRYCQKKKYPGEYCRRTVNCLADTICLWGRCNKHVRPGSNQSRCKMHNDCDEGLCCGRTDGESVCKPYLKEGQNCSVVKGGLLFSMNHSCPCGLGLICIPASPKLWKDHKQCAKIKP